MNSWTIFTADTIGQRAELGRRVMAHRQEAWERMRAVWPKTATVVSPQMRERTRIYATRTRVYERMLAYR